MSNIVANIIGKTEVLFKRIEENKKHILLYHLLLNEDKYMVIFNMQTIINQSLQCGNYRRACRYIIVAEHMLDEFENSAKTFTRKATKHFVKG